MARWIWVALVVPLRALADCNVGQHHPENGGYYIEGVAGVLNDVRSNVTGQRADNTTWAPDTYYPHGELKLCEGIFCSEEARVNGTQQYVYAHTCGLLRFSYDAPSTVYQMPDLHAFLSCDFTNAYLWGAADAGRPYFDYVIEQDHEQKVYYFASKEGCIAGQSPGGQKVAVTVVDDYANNAAQCRTMGAGSSRIQHCDCDHQLRPTTLVDPCFTGFYEGCMADMPDDMSCCPTSASYENGQYINGGTCIAKSREEGMRTVLAETRALCQSNMAACEVYEQMASCPSQWDSANYDPKCNQWKTIVKCGEAHLSGDAALIEECRTDPLWIVVLMVEGQPTTTATMSASTSMTEETGGANALAIGFAWSVIAVTLL